MEQQYRSTDSRAVCNSNEHTDNINEQQKFSNASTTYNSSLKQLHWTQRQVTGLERELLLNNYSKTSTISLSNWTKVFLCTLSVIIPGVGQVIGLIAGIVFVSNDRDSDTRSYGAALLTVSMIVFLFQLIFWFLMAVAFGPYIYY